MISEFRHVGIVVKDLEKTLHFYRDVLGLAVSKEMDEEGSFVDTILGLTKVKVKTIKMLLPQGGGIELLHYRSPVMPESSSCQIHERGITHFALTVKDLDSQYKRLSQEGVEFIAPPATSPNGYAKVAFCKDPEGNYIELVEVL